MNEVVYSHDTVWLLLHTIQHMDDAREDYPHVWRSFLERIADETAQGYPNSWETTFVINQIANDLGSYQLLLDIWFKVSEELLPPSQQ